MLNTQYPRSSRDTITPRVLENINTKCRSVCKTIPKTQRGKFVHEHSREGEQSGKNQRNPSISIIRRRIPRRPNKRTRHHAPWRRIPPQFRHPGRHILPKPTHTFPRLPILRDLESEIIRIQDVVNRVSAQIRLGPLDGNGDVEGFLVGVWIAGSGVADEVALVALGETAEAGEEGVADFAAENV